MAEEGRKPMPQQQAKPKGTPPMKKPEGTGSMAKPRVLTAPSLAKPIGSQETDMSKAAPHNVGNPVADAARNLEPGTIKKAMAFVAKGGDDPAPHRFTSEEVADIDRGRQKRLAQEAEEAAKNPGQQPPGKSLRGLAYQARMNRGRTWG